jgi:hypothetical protein
MAKPRKFGTKSTYIPNSRADMRNKKLYQRGREYTDKHETVMQKIRERRLARQKIGG